jgi:hypothetical protein
MFHNFLKTKSHPRALRSFAALAIGLAMSTAAAFGEPAPSPSPSPARRQRLLRCFRRQWSQAEARSLTNPSIQSLREQIQEIPGAAEIIDAETYKGGRSTTLKDALDYAPGASSFTPASAPRRRASRSVARASGAASMAADSNALAGRDSHQPCGREFRLSGDRTPGLEGCGRLLRGSNGLEIRARRLSAAR